MVWHCWSATNWATRTRDPVQRIMARIVLAVTGYGHFSAGA